MPITLSDLRKKKASGQKVTMVTAYDYTMASLCADAGADILLVGDSLGMVMLGYRDTVSVTMEDMIHHSRAVARGAKGAFVLTDMPFMSVRTGKRDALLNAGRLMREGRANGVKIEGGSELCDIVQSMTQAGIPVMAHLGLMPQSVNAVGGYHVQAREALAAHKLIQDAVALDAAGAFGVVLECVPREVAALVTARVRGVTIGIGAGCSCDGQVLVLQDLLGMYQDMQPRFVRRFAEVGSAVRKGVEDYCTAVREGAFPDDAHSFSLDPAVLALLEEALHREERGDGPEQNVR